MVLAISQTTWLKVTPHCNHCNHCELRKHFPSCLHLFLRTFQQPNPFCCNRSTTNLIMISFFSRTIDLFFFFLSLWIYLWLGETSQQPISQATWLKVTPHCNHCNHCNHLPGPTNCIKSKNGNHLCVLDTRKNISINYQSGYGQRLSLR